MNRKLFRIMTLVMTVMLILAFTVPALAETPNHLRWDDTYPLLDCNDDGTSEIWAHDTGFLMEKDLLDENGEPIEIFFHSVQKWHLYNLDYPELYLDGVTTVNHHSQKIGGTWFTGSELNFHAPGYPQLNHSSGYSWYDMDYNLIVQHGRFVPGDIAQFCELLTPP
jgi:hypothetical protein